MTSLLTLPVEAIVERYADGLAIVHRDILDGIDEVVGALDRVNKSDIGDHPGHVVAPLFRRHVAPVLQANLEGTGLALRVAQFDSLRLRFLRGDRAESVAKIRKRNSQWISVAEEDWPPSFIPEYRPGSLALLWDLEGDQVQSVVLARVDPETWDDVLAVYEETPLPPPAAPKTHQAPPGSSNDDDDLKGVVEPKNDNDETEGVTSA